MTAVVNTDGVMCLASYSSDCIHVSLPADLSEISSLRIVLIMILIVIYPFCVLVLKHLKSLKKKEFLNITW
jgi:hypothetical protein